MAKGGLGARGPKQESALLHCLAQRCQPHIHVFTLAGHEGLPSGRLSRAYQCTAAMSGVWCALKGGSGDTLLSYRKLTQNSSVCNA